MLSWMDRQSVDPGIARCSGPNHMTDRLIISNPSFEFRCNGMNAYSEIVKNSHDFCKV